MNKKEITNSIWLSNLPSSAKLVALCLVRHSTDQFFAISKAMIMTETRLTKKTVRRHIECLEAHGWLQVQRSGGGKPNQYSLTLPSV